MSARSGRPRQSTVSYEEVESDVDMSDGEREELAVAAREEGERYLGYNTRSGCYKMRQGALLLLRLLERTREVAVAVATKKAKGKKSEKNVITLEPFLSVPLDIFVEVCSHLASKDLINLSLSSKSFRNLLKSPAGRGIWAVKRREDGHPLIPGLSEFASASFLSGTTCLADLQVVSDELEVLQVLDDARPASLGNGTRSRPTTNVAVELEVFRFVEERKTWAEKQYKESQAIKKFIEQREQEEIEYRQAGYERERLHLHSLRDQLEARLKPIMLGFGWSDQKFQDVHRDVQWQIWAGFLKQLSGGVIEDEYWISIEDKVVAEYEERFTLREENLAQVATNARRQVLRPYYNQLAHQIEDPVPDFSDFLSFPSVTSFWKDPSSTVDQQSFNAARTSILKDFERHREPPQGVQDDTRLKWNFFARFGGSCSQSFHRLVFLRTPCEIHMRKLVEDMSNPSLVRFLRHILDTAGLDEESTFDEVQRAGLRFRWAENKRAGKGTASLTWTEIGSAYLPQGGRTSNRPLPTLTLVTGNTPKPEFEDEQDLMEDEA
ncbi:hypothetical protein P7C70_g5014, partial [Phenoliferia sp. Uapishka_3]